MVIAAERFGPPRVSGGKSPEHIEHGWLARAKLQLLGGFALEIDCEPAAPIRISSRKAAALVAYLAIQPRNATAGPRRNACDSKQWRRGYSNRLQIASTPFATAEAQCMPPRAWSHWTLCGKIGNGCCCGSMRDIRAAMPLWHMRGR